jgi:hypothetical protein
MAAMGNFSDLQPKTLSLASMSCKVRAGIWEPHVAVAEADDVVNECSEKSENHVSCRNPDLGDFISDVGGLDFSVSIDQSVLPALPRFIPILEKSFLWSSPSLIPGQFVGVSLSDIFKSSLKQTARRLKSPPFHIDQRLPLSPFFAQKTVILFMSAQDVLIEEFWMKHRELGLFPVLRRAGFQFATTPNFSVFAGECPLGHAINQKKSLVCAKLLQEAGITPIPHLYSINQHHADRYISYLKEHPSIRTVIINCTLQRKARVEVDAIVKEVGYLLDRIPDLHIIIQGLHVHDSPLLFRYKSNLHYAGTTPFFSALFHRKTVYDPSEKKIQILSSPESKFELAPGNVGAHLDYFRNL